jgi:hypothetical protein
MNEHYANPAEELLEQPALRALQRRKLGAMMAEVRAGNAFTARSWPAPPSTPSTIPSKSCR